MPSETFVALATFTASGTETSVTFSNIPNTYRDLRIQGSVKGNEVNGVFAMELNGSAANRSHVRMWTNGGSRGSDTGNDGICSATIGNDWGSLIIDIMDYATDKHKTTLIRSNDGNVIVIGGAARWADTSAVTSVKISSNRTYQSGMTLSLYGIAG